MSDGFYTRQGKFAALNITAATVLKVANPMPGVLTGDAGRIIKVSVLVAGSGVGSVNDCATTAAAATANELFVIPTTVGIYNVDMPCAAGLCITPGTGQTLAVTYD